MWHAPIRHSPARLTRTHEYRDVSLLSSSTPSPSRIAVRTQNPETVRLTPASGDKELSVTRGFGLFGLAAGAMLLVAAVTSTTVRAAMGISSVSELNDGAMRTLARLGSGVSPVTFTVHLCGVPDEVWNRHVPWPVCRVKLVGCPSTGNCWRWRYHQGIEMEPTDASRNVFTVTTSEYGAGDSFGFAVIEAGCTMEHEAACDVPGEDAPAFCKEQELCDHRYDSGTANYTTQGDKDHSVTCWKDKQRCSSASPFFYVEDNARSCLREPNGPWFNRVLPSGSVANGEYSAIWGSCETEPVGDAKTQCVNAASVQSMCTALEKPMAVAEKAVEPLGGCEGKTDGSFAQLIHKLPGSEFIEVTSTCCGGVACEPGHICLVNGECGAIDPMPEPGPTGATCVSGDDAAPGMCTQSCGSGNDDCDKTCGAAADASGLELDCVVGGTGNDMCQCSNVAGKTAEECELFPNQGWKCCTCKSLKQPTTGTDTSGNTDTSSGTTADDTSGTTDTTSGATDDDTTVETTTPDAPAVTKSPDSPKLEDLGSAAGLGMACNGAVATGAGSSLTGGIVSGGGFISGAKSSVTGDIEALGAAEFGADAHYNGTLTCQAAVHLGDSDIYSGDIYSTAAVHVGASVKMDGNVYSSVTLAIGAGADVTGVKLSGTASQAVPSFDQGNAIAAVKNALDNYVSNGMDRGEPFTSSVKDRVLLPGEYYSIPALAYEGDLTFRGTSADTWVIRVTGALSFNGKIFLEGGALSSNIHWVVNAAAKAEAASVFHGKILAQGAISIDAEATMFGSLNSMAACALLANTKMNYA